MSKTSRRPVPAARAVDPRHLTLARRIAKLDAPLQESILELVRLYEKLNRPKQKD